MNPVQWVIDRAGTDQTPTLETFEVQQIVERAARRDQAGTVPFGDGWVPTYDLNSAAAEALEARAAKVLTRFDLTVDGQTLRREQMHKALMAAAKMYRLRTVGTIRRDPPDFGGNPRDVILGGG